MLAGGDHTESLKAEPDAPDEESFELEDPTIFAPVGSREEFTALMDGIVADSAPRVFAIVQEYGDRVDGWIVGWGMAFDDHADIVVVDSGWTMKLQTPENALYHFAGESHCTPRLAWVNPDAASPAEDNEEPADREGAGTRS